MVWGLFDCLPTKGFFFCFWRPFFLSVCCVDVLLAATVGVLWWKIKRLAYLPVVVVFAEETWPHDHSLTLSVSCVGPHLFVSRCPNLK